LRRTRRRSSALFAACLGSALFAGVLTAAPAFASGPTCGTAGGVTVCISVPSTTLTGYELVTASANPPGGEVQFTWAASNNSCVFGFGGACHLVHQFDPLPGTTTDYSFMWPTQKNLDGPGTLQAFVIGVLTPAVSISGLTLSNGNVGSILGSNKSPGDWASYLPPSSWSGSTDPTFAAVGDGADDKPIGESVIASVASTSPPLFLYLGDVYEDGTSGEMLNHYGWNSMDGPCPLSDCSSIAQWGQLGAVTQPTIGNHEYQASPATDGSAWQDYWHQRPLSMSFTFANTLFIDLNCGPKAALCDFGVGSAQYMSVTNLLSAPHPPCVVTYWHIPALSKNIAQKDLTPMWKLLTDNGGTMVLNGHVHHMEEYLNLNDQMQTATAGQPTMAQLIAGSGDVSKVQASDQRMTWPTYPQQGVQGIPGALYLTLNGAANGGTPTSISYSFEGVNHNPLHSNTVPCGGLPAITGFNPTSGSAGTQVTITGSKLTGATALKFNGTSDPSFSVDSDTQITAHVPAGATTGPICATVSGSPVCSSSSFVVPQPPQVTGFSPGSGPPGTQVTVSGVNFTGATTVAFNGTSDPTFHVDSDTQITAHIPSGAGTGPICVTVSPNTGCSSTNFTVTPPVGINRIGLVGPPVTNPPGGALQLSMTVGAGGVVAGDRVVVAIGVQNAITITSVTDSKGNSYTPSITYAFSGTGKCTTALYSAQLATPLVSGDTITVKVSAGSAWGFIAEDWSGLISTDQTGKADSGGASTTTVSISTTGPTASSNEAVFGVACIAGNSTITGDPLYSNVTKLKNVNSPTTRYLALESRVISTTGVQTATYTLSPAQAWSGVIGTFSGGSVSGPQVTGFSPTSGTPGTSVTVNGTGFTGASAVTFNGLSASFAPGSDTQLTATVPGSATTGPICVTVGANTGCSAASFIVTQPPQVTGFNPTSGTPGTSVTLTGLHFTGASGVTFNGTPASSTVTNDTTISTSVPSGATDGVICVTNSAGTGCSAGSFDVTAGSGLAFVQASSGATGASSSVAPSWPATTGSGSGVLLVATVSVNTGSTTGTFSAPQGWTLAAQSAVASGSHTAVFYIANPGSGRSGSETFTYSKTGRSIYGALMEYNGFSAAAVVDKIATSNGTSTSPSTGTTATDTAAAEVLVGAIGNRNTSTASGQAEGGSATCGAVSERAEAFVGSGGTGLAGRAIDCVQTATGTAEFHSTLSGSQLWTGVIVTFR
jgi:hypothetical protein